MRTLRTPRRLVSWLVASIAIAWVAPILDAHDIPADTTVRVFIKPEGKQLHLVVRVPMAAINDIDWPVRKTDGTLDLSRAESALRDASTQWISDYADMYEGGTKLPYPTLTSVRLSNEGDPSFDTYEHAFAHLNGARLPEDSRLLPNQGMLDALFDYAIQSDASRFSFYPRWDRFGLRVVTILRFLPPHRDARAFEYAGGDIGRITLDPEWYQAAWSFVRMGFSHVLEGSDHLLFLFCLIIPLRRFRSLVAVVSAFVVAHSVTLIASIYDMAPGASWFPPLIDTLMAISILYMAFENIIVSAPRRRWVMAFAFGLAHGFGFAFALGQSVQFAGTHLLTSLLSFNLGLEIGQIAMLALMVPALALLFRFVAPQRAATIVLSGLAAHTAWHWTLDRYAILSRYQFTLPSFDAGFLANVLRWLMVLVAIAFVLWLINVLRQGKPRGTGETRSAGL